IDSNQGEIEDDVLPFRRARVVPRQKRHVQACSDGIPGAGCSVSCHSGHPAHALLVTYQESLQVGNFNSRLHISP
ncbi:Os03g0338800, partial [Oryza sativa Japonica Group]